MGEVTLLNIKAYYGNMYYCWKDRFITGTVWTTQKKIHTNMHNWFFFNGAKQFNGERIELTIKDAEGNWTFTSPNKQTHASKPHTVYKFNNGNHQLKFSM